MSLRLTIILTVLKCPSLPCGVKKYDDAMFILCRRVDLFARRTAAAMRFDWFLSFC